MTPELTDPPRPRPGALEADAVRGRQIEQLQQENRALAARVAQMERVLGPAFPPKRPAPALVRQHQEADIFAADPMHDQRVVNAQIHGGSVVDALREVAADPSNPRRAQKAAFALDYLAAGRVRHGETTELVTSVADAIDAAEAEVRRGWYARQGVQGMPLGASEGAPGQPVQRSAVHAGVEPLGQREV